jgi:N-acetylmuramoyl-L-alanine amidase
MRDGTLQLGRGQQEIGAHTPGYNDVSVGVAMVGGVVSDGRPGKNFKLEQFYTLSAVTKYWKAMWPGIIILGHSDLIKNSKCPSFDVQGWMDGMFNHARKTKRGEEL